MALLKKTTAPALLASLAFHVAAVGAVGLARRAPSLAALDSEVVEIDVVASPAPPELPEPPPPPAPQAPGATVAIAAVGVTAHALRSVSSLDRTPTPVAVAPEAVLTAPATPEPASSSSWSLPQTAPRDIGIGTYWRSVATSGDPLVVAQAEPAPAPPRPSPNRILRDGLDAHDRALGLGTGGPLISAAHDAASPSIAPDVGSATFDVESDATGRVVAARVVSASAETSAWNDVAQELVRLMSAKTLRVLRDSRGTRTRLRIVAQRTLPSGAAYERSAGAVSEESCSGQAVGPGGLGKKCNAGMPTGLTQSFDVADIGARASRIVRVQLLGEAAL